MDRRLSGERGRVRSSYVLAVILTFIVTAALCMPSADKRYPEQGDKVKTSDGSTIDYSHADQGYILVKQKKTTKKVKVRVSKDGVTLPEYDLAGDNQYDTIPLQLGSGKYSVRFFLQTSGKTYATNATFTVNAALENENIAFLYPSQYVWYTKDSQAVTKSNELCEGLTSDADKVEAIAGYIKRNIIYDFFFAMKVTSGYLPDVDTTLTTGKGICFDYAALFACMLRVQDIPCRLVIGDAGRNYHAWNNVLLNGQWRFYDLTYESSGTKIVESSYAVERFY